MKRILCAFDGSPHAAKALQWATELARRYDAQLSLLYVVEPYVPPIDVPGVSPVDFVDSHTSAGRRMLADAAEKAAKQSGLTPQIEVRVGSPAHEIVECAAHQQADLVVVGSRGHGAVKRFLLGSVADRIVHSATVPVLVVR